VFQRELRRFRGCIRTGAYVLTHHAAQELRNDDLSVSDVENCVLSGEVIKRQRDRVTGEWKFVIAGWDTCRLPCCVVAKRAWTGNMLILTVFRD